MYTNNKCNVWYMSFIELCPDILQWISTYEFSHYDNSWFCAPYLWVNGVGKTPYKDEWRGHDDLGGVVDPLVKGQTLGHWHGHHTYKQQGQRSNARPLTRPPHLQTTRSKIKRSATETATTPIKQQRNKGQQTKVKSQRWSMVKRSTTDSHTYKQQGQRSKVKGRRLNARPPHLQSTMQPRSLI
jgi:hypothetical protein